MLYSVSAARILTAAMSYHDASPRAPIREASMAVIIDACHVCRSSWVSTPSSDELESYAQMK